MIHPELPLQALSIMQPWTWLIAQGLKDIENRSRRASYRGTVALHAGKNVDYDAHRDLASGLHPVTGEQCRFEGVPVGFFERGGIVGVAEIVECVAFSPSPWFVGRYGYVIANARPVPFIPCRGELGFFYWRRNLK